MREGANSTHPAYHQDEHCLTGFCLQEKHPCLLQNFPQFFNRAADKRVAVFLDYDGECCFPCLNGSFCTAVFVRSCCWALLLSAATIRVLASVAILYMSVYLTAFWIHSLRHSRYQEIPEESSQPLRDHLDRFRPSKTCSLNARPIVIAESAGTLTPIVKDPDCAFMSPEVSYLQGPYTVLLWRLDCIWFLSIDMFQTIKHWEWSDSSAVSTTMCSTGHIFLTISFSPSALALCACTSSIDFFHLDVILPLYSAWYKLHLKVKSTVLLMVHLFWSQCICGVDETDSEISSLPVPNSNHQWQRARKGARLCAAARIILCWQPWHGYRGTHCELSCTSHSTKAAPEMSSRLHIHPAKIKCYMAWLDTRWHITSHLHE